MYNKYQFSAAFRSQKRFSFPKVITLMTTGKRNHIALLYKLSFIKKLSTPSDGVM